MDQQLINQKDSFTGYHTKQSLLAYLNFKFSGSLDSLRLSLLIVDLDRFKAINDHYGHLTGDEALKHFVKILNKVLNGKHFVARYGGDEFVIVIDDTQYANPSSQIAQSVELANQIVAQLSQSQFYIQKKLKQLHCSIGIAHCPQDAKDHFSFVEAADNALYYAKRHGRGRVAVFSKLGQQSIQDTRRDILKGLTLLSLVAALAGIIYMNKVIR